MFKSIKGIFKSKESDYWDNADYSRNTNDNSNWEDEPYDSSKETRLSNMLLLICIIAIYLLWLLPKSEILKTLYEHGYWYVIVIYIALSAIIIMPVTYFISFFILMAYHVQTTITILKGIWKILIFMLCVFFFLGVMGNPFDGLLDIVIKKINYTDMTPSYTIRTVITDRYDCTRFRYIRFKDGDKTKEIRPSHIPIGKYNKGDSIKIVYGKGCLGITDIMDWDLIEYHEETLEEHLKKIKTLEEHLKKTKTLSDYGPDTESSLGEYLKARLPEMGNSYQGWTEASFSINAVGDVHNVRVSSNGKIGNAIRKAMTDMGKWIGTHKDRQKERVKISLAYRLGRPYYLTVKRIVTSTGGTKLKINDEYDLSGDNGYACWSVHEETKE